MRFQALSMAGSAGRSRRCWRPAAAGLLTLLFIPPLTGQTLGEAPAPGAGARDLPAAYPLPPLHDTPGSELATLVDGSQVGKRARALGLDSRSALAAWRAADAVLANARARLKAPAPARPRRFDGGYASSLNALLRDPQTAAVRVVSKRLLLDEPLKLQRSRLWLDLGRAELRAARGGPRFMVRIENASDVTLVGGRFLEGKWGVLIDRSDRITVQASEFSGLSGGGIALTGARHAVVGHTTSTKLGGASILVHGASVGVAIVSNDISANLGASNWNAGIVVSDRVADVAADPARMLQADRYGVIEQSIGSRLVGPIGTVVAYNRIIANAASGIYSDGGTRSVIVDNVIEANSKEGLCLDNGSTANVVAFNTIRLNGKRWGKSDAELRLDFIDRAGRLADGSSTSKTPGVSLDNAIHNIVYANLIERNFGGGLKMVRTAFFNLVGLNTLIDNNRGASARYHFFGIELGAASADAPVSDLDFLPSRGNIVFGNSVQGTHYAGIFFASGSTDNDIFDNTIFGATPWAMEQVAPQPNASLNNLTNLPSRNIANGLEVRRPKAELPKGK